jgi:hypothetical protein
MDNPETQAILGTKDTGMRSCSCYLHVDRHVRSGGTIVMCIVIEQYCKYMHLHIYGQLSSGGAIVMFIVM